MSMSKQRLGRSVKDVRSKLDAQINGVGLDDTD